MKRLTAVIAEDEANLREELRETLAALWPELAIVAEAEDGEEALAALEIHAPAIMFLDIQMPGMSGLDVARRASGRKDRPRVAVEGALRRPRGRGVPVERLRERVGVALQIAGDDRVGGEARRDERLVHAVAGQGVDEAGRVADEEDATLRRGRPEAPHREAMPAYVRQRIERQTVCPGQPGEMVA